MHVKTALYNQGLLQPHIELFEDQKTSYTWKETVDDSKITKILFAYDKLL